MSSTLGLTPRLNGLRRQVFTAATTARLQRFLSQVL
jgi:hypothetical protein